MNESEIEILEIRSLGAKGDGIALWRDRPVYLRYGLPGDRVRAEIGDKQGDGRRGRILERLGDGPDRIAPVCAHFGACGGCAAQHLAPELYRGWKSGNLRTALAQQGIDESCVRPMIDARPGTRRRAAFAFRKRGGALSLGFMAPESHDIVDLAECPVAVPALAALLAPLRAGLAALLAEGAKGEAWATYCDSGVDLLVKTTLGLDLGLRGKLAELARGLGLARLSWQVDKEEPELVIAAAPAQVSFAGTIVELPAAPFLQASAEGEAAIARELLEALGKEKKVVDLFAGLGSFTFPVARSGEGRAVHAVEGDGRALDALQAAARRAGLGRVTAEKRDLFRNPLRAQELERFDAILIDPPRIGAAAQTKEIAKTKKPRLVLAVSCNPASFARDARHLIDAGWRLERVTPIDQFLWSHHLEAVGIFRR